MADHDADAHAHVDSHVDLYGHADTDPNTNSHADHDADDHGNIDPDPDGDVDVFTNPIRDTGQTCVLARGNECRSERLVDAADRGLDCLLHNQPDVLVLGVAQHLAQHFLGVLPQKGRAAIDPEGSA